MLTRRDLKVMFATLALSWGAMALAQEKIAASPPPVMGSSIFDWTQLPVRKSEKGEVRKVLRAATATLD